MEGVCACAAVQADENCPKVGGKRVVCVGVDASCVGSARGRAMRRGSAKQNSAGPAGGSELAKPVVATGGKARRVAKGQDVGRAYRDTRKRLLVLLDLCSATVAAGWDLGWRAWQGRVKRGRRVLPASAQNWTLPQDRTASTSGATHGESSVGSRESVRTNGLHCTQALLLLGGFLHGRPLCP